MNQTQSLFQGNKEKKKVMFFSFLLLLLIQHVDFTLARLTTTTTATTEIFSSSNEEMEEEPNHQNNNLKSSNNIPPLKDTIELVKLSNLVYEFVEKGATNCSSFPSIYDEYQEKESARYPTLSKETNFTFHCHMYERDSQDTQVLVVSRQSTNPNGGSYGDEVEATASSSTTSTTSTQDYIAVVFAGTDDFKNALTDTNILTKHFGPEYYNDDDKIDYDRNYNFPDHSENIRVHAGFNNAVFKRGLFDRIYDQIVAYKEEYPNGRIFTTGHSLGASDAVLTAVALKIQDEFADEEIHSINFGCPKTGNYHWKEFVNHIDGLGIWRVVNGLDLVPRLPGFRFHHVGHTIQLNNHDVKAYWLHEGDRSLGYAGIPFGWNTLPYALAPEAAYEHLMKHYEEYLCEKSSSDPDTHYFNEFEKIGDGETELENNYEAVDERPLRPRSAYSFFYDEEKQRILTESLDLDEMIGDVELVKKIGLRYRNLSKNQLEHYIDLAGADLQRYKKEMKEYDNTMKEKQEVERQFANDYQFITTYNKLHDHSPVLSSTMLDTKEA